MATSGILVFKRAGKSLSQSSRLPNSCQVNIQEKLFPTHNQNLLKSLLNHQLRIRKGRKFLKVNTLIVVPQ